MARGKQGRYVRRSAVEWSRLVSEQAGGGLSQREFCERRRLSYSSFSRWKRRVGEEGASEDDGFVELTVAPSAPEPTWEVELGLGEGVVLRVRRR